MASLRAHIGAWMVKRTVRARLGAMRNIEDVRRIFNGATFPDPPGATYTEARLGDVPGEWVRPRAGTGPRLFYVHGGGFVACSARTHRPVTGGFATRGLTLFAPDYRLAPEHPFPAGRDDVLAAWCAFAAEGPACIAGDSAGGNLALAAMLAARERGLPLPRAAVFFSPVTDFTATDGSRASNAQRDAMFEPEGLASLGPLYLAGHDPHDPMVSPVRADLAGLPPMLFHVGEREILRDDSVRLVERARAQGVDATVEVFPVVNHVWQFADHRLPEARRSLDTAAAFLRRHAGTGRP